MLEEEISHYLLIGSGKCKKTVLLDFYNHVTSPARTNPKGTQRNEILELRILHLVEIGKFKYVQYIYWVSMGICHMW